MTIFKVLLVLSWLFATSIAGILVFCGIMEHRLRKRINERLKALR